MLTRIFKRIKRGPALIVTALTISFLLVLSISDHLQPATIRRYESRNTGIDISIVTVVPSQRTSNRNEILKTCAGVTTDGVDNFFGKVKSNMDVWSFQEKIDCKMHNIDAHFTDRKRRRMNLQCSSGIFGATYSETLNASDIFSSENGNPCLSTYIRTCCGSNRVPNVAHYVWYKRGEMTFIAFLSMLSVVRFVRPCVIMVHGELPYGKYWDAITYFYPNFVHIKRDIPEDVFGTKIRINCHSSDIMRIEALIEYGGIYLDMDMVLVRPIDSLMDFPFVLSNQSSANLGSAFVMAERNATFLNLWMNEYRTDYQPNRYIYNAMKSSGKLAVMDEYKHLIHIEHNTLSRPHKMRFLAIHDLAKATYNWSHVYGIHTYIRIFHETVNETTIKTMNSTFGSICRHIFYGDKELCV
ncbi:hypothetical protein ACF0H5_015656 [Mactra antiquata]